jgi:glycosyltransferase involved in cell wall biosynthesis
MMRIVLATTVREKGGVWRHVTDVAAGLCRRGHKVEIDLVQAASLLREDASARGFSLREESVRTSPDIWHLHLADTYCRDSLRSLVSARRSGALVVVTEHLPRTDASDPSARSRSGASRPGAWAAKTAFKQFEFSLSDRVIAVSESSRRFLLTRYGVPPRKVVTVPNGVRPRNVMPSPSETPPRFVAVGSVIAQKGFDLLVEAAALARAPWSAEIVGDGPHLVELRERASRLARPVRFVGRREDVASSLRSATALVLPSRWEAWPYVAMEAMQQGVAVVAFRVDGLPEMVDDGTTGLLVDPESPGSLAEALDRLAGDARLARTMGRNGRCRVALFDEESMLDGLVRVYTGMTSRRRSTDLAGMPS